MSDPTKTRISRALLSIGAVAAVSLAAIPAARAQDDSASTFRVILFVAEDGAPQEVGLERLQEVWSEEEGLDRLRTVLRASRIRRLEDVTVLPNRETPALRMGGVTLRVRGAYEDPRRRAMFLRVEAEGGRETFVKEMISRFDETIVVAYPLAEGDRSLVALIVPVPLAR